MAMRCYFMRGRRIEAVEILKAAPDDNLIRQAKSLFEDRAAQYDGFEVWDGGRFVYREPWEAEKEPPAGQPSRKKTS